MLLDRLAFGGVKQIGIAFVRYDSKAGFFMQQLASKGIRHTDRARTQRVHDRVLQAIFLQEFAAQDPLVDEINRFTSGIHFAACKIQIIRCTDYHVDIVLGKVVLKEQKFTGSRHTFPVYNCHIGQLTLIAQPLVIDAQQRIQGMVTHFHWLDIVAILELLHQRRF